MCRGLAEGSQEAECVLIAGCGFDSALVASIDYDENVSSFAPEEIES